MTIKYVNGVWIAFARTCGNPCLAEGNSFLEAFNGCIELISKVYATSQAGSDRAGASA